ncbi:MAG: hypothetical protein CBARDMAM_6880 [uncultured Caballeronia sp.]|nr:MAG: hypothetical protein CBARDMAM_6880 [uncultured Caballeronia sp.]
MVSHPIYCFTNSIANEDHGGVFQTFLHGVDSQAGPVVQASGARMLYLPTEPRRQG